VGLGVFFLSISAWMLFSDNSLKMFVVYVGAGIGLTVAVLRRFILGKPRRYWKYYLRQNLGQTKITPKTSTKYTSNPFYVSQKDS